MQVNLCPFTIYPITPQEMRDRREEQASERYHQLYAELEAADRAAYEDEMGGPSEFLTAHPFKPNGVSIHERVTAMMQHDD